MSYVVVAILGSVSGVVLAWHFLVPIVAVLAVTIGVTGALNARPAMTIAEETALVVCLLEGSWIASAYAVDWANRTFPRRRQDRNTVERRDHGRR